jgi:hypothetical protein
VNVPTAPERWYRFIKTSRASYEPICSLHPLQSNDNH